MFCTCSLLCRHKAVTEEAKYKIRGLAKDKKNWVSFATGIAWDSWKTVYKIQLAVSSVSCCIMRLHLFRLAGSLECC